MSESSAFTELKQFIYNRQAAGWIVTTADIEEFLQMLFKYKAIQAYFGEDTLLNQVPLDFPQSEMLFYCFKLYSREC